MNKYMKTLIVLLFSTVLSAEQTSSYSLSMAGVGMSMDYREYEENGAIFNTENSTFSEIVGLDTQFTYTEVLDNKDYSQINIDMMFLNGTTQYIGAQYDLTTGDSGDFGSYVGTTVDFVSNLSVEYIYTSILNNDFELSYGIGLGYREWERELSPSQIEVYSWLSVRPMVGITYNMDKFSVSGQIEYQYGISPTMTLLGDAENDDIELNLGLANIFALNVPLTYEINEQLKVFFEYTFEQQIIEKSNSARYIYAENVYEIHEPRSETCNQYLKFGATFKF